MPTSIKIDVNLKETLIYGKPEDAGFKVVEEGEWINNYKDCDLKETVFQQLSTGKFYAYYESRSGSYYTDYEYDSPDELVEVIPVEITIIKYEAAQ